MTEQLTERSRFTKIGERYSRLLETPKIRAFLNSGGVVALATEHQSLACMKFLAGMGHRHFAEKFVGEAERKLPALRQAHPDIHARFFGSLQSNKIRRLTRLFQHVESIDSARRALRLKVLMGDHGNLCHNCMVQVNYGNEPQKQGACPADTPGLIEYCLELGLPVVGLMTIPPRHENPSEAFRCLRSMADRFSLPYCQMGFSADYAIAIDCGATHIRIGSALFGNTPDFGSENA